MISIEKGLVRGQQVLGILGGGEGFGVVLAGGVAGVRNPVAEYSE